MHTEHVEPQQIERHNSPRIASKTVATQAATESLAGDGFCYWNDKKYSDGATVCDNRRRYECWNGKWAEIGDC